MNNHQIIPEHTENTTPAKDDPELLFLDTKAVARFLGCSLSTARQIMYRSDFPLIKVGKNLRVEQSALREWAMQRRV